MIQFVGLHQIPWVDDKLVASCVDATGHGNEYSLIEPSNSSSWLPMGWDFVMLECASFSYGASSNKIQTVLEPCPLL